MRFLADENFNNKILKALLDAEFDLDVVRAQDTEIYQTSDPIVLEWAAQQGRILLTHDVQTMPNFAHQRVRAGLPMPGVILVHDNVPVGRAIDELLIMIGASPPSDFESQVKFIPIT
jgi:predicted nuclease of predicted toxin-antitoxin system